MNIVSFLKLPFIILGDFAKLFLIYTPGRTGVRLRRAYYQKNLKHCGENLVVDVGVCIDGPELISIGDNVYIDKYCVIATGKTLSGNIKRKINKSFQYAEGEIVIGNDVHIAQSCIIMGYGGVSIGDKCGLSSGVKLYSLTNVPNDWSDPAKRISIMPLGSSTAPYILSPVVFHGNVWIALNSIVLPGADVGEDTFVASQSVVSSKVRENSYISGQPAKKIRERFLTKIKEDL